MSENVSHGVVSCAEMKELERAADAAGLSFYDMRCECRFVLASEYRCDLRRHPAESLTLCVDEIPLAFYLLRLLNK